MKLHLTNAQKELLGRVAEMHFIINRLDGCIKVGTLAEHDVETFRETIGIIEGFIDEAMGSLHREGIDFPGNDLLSNELARVGLERMVCHLTITPDPISPAKA